MPIISSYADIIRDWEALLVAIIDKLAHMPEKLTEGRATAIRLRGAIKAALGHTHEGLVQYGMVPRRHRVRRPKLVEAPTAEDANRTAPPSVEGEPIH
ncbi:MAG TPA: hypothetical protein VEL74_21930 [Thermoanaerobaculia bacterium]|nr:hypothetical protein [Thermoanaerobaculia bacterium]